MDSLVIVSLGVLILAFLLALLNRLHKSQRAWRVNVSRETFQKERSKTQKVHAAKPAKQQSKTGIFTRLIRRKDRDVSQSATHIDTALTLEILASQLEAGMGLEQALETLADALPQNQTAKNLRTICTALTLGADWDSAWGRYPNDRLLLQLSRILAPGAASGSPSAALLRNQSAAHRTTRRRAAERAAGKLSVALVLPLGLCSLPAFICLGIVPILVSLLPTLGGQ